MKPYNRRLIFSALACAAVFLAAAPRVSGQGETPSAEARVARVIDSLHDAASKAEFDRYFGLYADGAIFLGTDATERWTIDQFKAYAKPSFDAGRGWTYVPRERHIYFSADGQTAWFDELLDNANLGLTRGSGVLVRIADEWKVTQYNLTIPIPNELSRQVVKMIREANPVKEEDAEM